MTHTDLLHSTIHSLRFTRHREAPIFRASCTCGWSREGTCEEVQSAAATHDMDEANEQR